MADPDKALATQLANIEKRTGKTLAELAEIVRENIGARAWAAILAFIWLYLEARDAQRISALSLQIFWLVIPSLAFFLLLPLLLKLRFHFWISLGLAMAGTSLCYLAMTALLRHWNLLD